MGLVSKNVTFLKSSLSPGAFNPNVPSEHEQDLSGTNPVFINDYMFKELPVSAIPLTLLFVHRVSPSTTEK